MELNRPAASADRHHDVALLTSLRQLVVRLLPELTRFGLIGLIGLLVDVGGFYWTFRHTRRSAVHHEFGLFVLMCTIGSGMAVACLAISHYVLGFTSPLADNIAANVVGLALGTTFRFWAYRTHVFSERQPADAESDCDATASTPPA